MLLFTSLLRGNVEELKFVEEERIGAVDPLEKEIDGEPGGGVETGLSFDVDMVDFRRNQDDLMVLLPLNSKSNGSWLKEVLVSGATGFPATPASPSALLSGIEGAVKFAKLSLLDEDSGRPKEFRFRSREVGAEAGCAMDDVGGEGIGVELCWSKVNRDGAFLLPEPGLWSVAGFRWPRARPTAAIPTVPVAHSC